ncbi:MAG: M23 family metallopeptidase [Thermodesulfobacteria bacterium]|nr:M23 family metallopeptidase [Thermodesulfobacteriota bacterium]
MACNLFAQDASRPILSLPIACHPLKNCFIQNYVDLDPTSAVHDYTCGKASYDGHRGTDFRTASIEAMEKGVPVFAAAPGKVKTVRDGMTDSLVVSESDRSLILHQECGNGLLVLHADGWETQYCHLRQGSLRVRPGDFVKRGQLLGLVGLSGNTTFPHVHLTVRYKGQVIDPFTGTVPGDMPCSSSDGSLWHPSVLNAFPYSDGQPFVMGFADHAVGEAELMQKGELPWPSSRDVPALVFYGMVLNLQKGDQLRIVLTGPDGELAHTATKPFNRHKASYLFFAGKKRGNGYWPAGTYQGVFSLLREDRILWSKAKKLVLTD